jgi:hypothetical protein
VSEPDSLPESRSLADLLAGPLMAAHSARVEMARATLDHIRTTGFEPTADGDVLKPRKIEFELTRPAGPGPDGQILSETVKTPIPLLAIVEMSSQTIKDVSIDFALELTTVTPPDADGGPAILSGLVHASDAIPPTGAAPRVRITLKAKDVGVSAGLSQVIETLTEGLPPKAPLSRS